VNDSLSVSNFLTCPQCAPCSLVDCLVRIITACPLPSCQAYDWLFFLEGSYSLCCIYAIRLSIACSLPLGHAPACFHLDNVFAVALVTAATAVLGLRTRSFSYVRRNSGVAEFGRWPSARPKLFFAAGLRIAGRPFGPPIAENSSSRHFVACPPKSS